MTIGMLLVAIILIMPIALGLFGLLGYWNSKTRYKLIYCAMFAMIFGIAGFCFKDPATNPDLVRYLQILHQYKGETLFESFNLAYNNLFAVDIYFHIVSLFKNDQMLPAISAFLYYFVILYIMKDYRLRVSINNLDFMIYSSFVVCATIFCSIVNGIRWPLSFILFILAFYRDVVQKKKNVWTWMIYIASILFHFSAIVLLLIRLILFIKDKKIVIIIGAFGVLVPQLIRLLSDRFGSINTGITVIDQLLYSLNRSNMYFQWNQGEWADIVRNSTYYKIEACYYYVIAFLLLLCLLLLYKKKNKDGINRKSFTIEDRFSFYLMVVTLISFTMSAHTYIRFVTPVIVCFVFVVFRFYKEYQTSVIRKIINGSFVLLSGVGIFLNLYLLRTMVDLPEYFSDIVTFGLFKFILGY